MRKYLPGILVLCTTILLFTACQKELTAGDELTNPPGSNGGTATYSFAGGTGTCTAAIISGTYNKGSVLNANDTVIITVKVDSIGTYTVATASINGIIFIGSGTFTATGLQAITLKGSGTPLAAGSFVFTPGSAGCTFIINFTATGASSGTALFTLNGSPDSCTTPLIKGTYMQGQALTASDTVVIKATVATIGSYTISTNSINGMMFSASGNFTTTGLHTVTLVGAGAVAEVGTFTFAPGTNGCQFKIITTAPPTSDCKECIYIPICLGSKYEYVDSMISPNFSDTGFTTTVNPRLSNFVSSEDTTINGRGFKKMGVSDGSTTNYAYLNCLNGETTTIAYQSQSITSGNVMTEINSVELKANASVGTSWTDSSVVAGNKLYRAHTIMQKDISRVLLGFTYTNVIRVSVNETVQTSQGLTPAGVTEYYIAKGIGLIETVGYGQNPSNGLTYVFYHSVVKSYFVP